MKNLIYIIYLFFELRRLNKAMKKVGIINMVEKEICYSDVYESIKKDNSKSKKEKTARKLLTKIYKIYKKIYPYIVKDYSLGKEIFYNNEKLGVNYKIDGNQYVGKYVKIVAKEYVYFFNKEKNIYEYINCDYLPNINIGEIFLIEKCINNELLLSGDFEFNKNQVCFCSKEEEEKEIEKNFILSEN